MKDAIQNCINEHKKLIEAFETDCIDSVAAAVDLLTDCFKAGGTVYLCGNGGSAADAQHVAGEFVGRLKHDKIALPAVALSVDCSVLTCVSNDYGFEEVFARQIQALGRKGDVLWAFSTSGTSKNVLKAVDAAKSQGLKIIGFVGRPDSPLEKLSDVCVGVDSQWSCGAQEVHQLAYHIICDLVERTFT
ncbi:Phosphoheptose isomerase [Anaerohalosphaera lusitana]|uniref:Phosphoheptose isomerase n=1 Tax=Anaerohalosphaera lusitana TaxID=1936003 RepID=A0A1U9NP19_9BACT|nr:SIS domain-containing protein [Anaerohalosphaera lusitana]AQT69350.1 Phosphoheptose isomerase [Anaerohalosphaera lusitana]